MMRNYIVALLVIIGLTIVVLVTILPVTKRRVDVITTTNKSIDPSPMEVVSVKRSNVVAATRSQLPLQTLSTNESHPVVHAVTERERMKQEQERERMKQEQERERMKQEQERERMKQEQERERMKQEQERGRMKQEQERGRMKQEQERERMKQEQERERMKQEEQERRRQQEEQERRRQQEEQERRRQQEEQERHRQQEEQERRHQQEEQERRRQQEEQERRRQQEEQERRRQNSVTESRGDITVDVKAATQLTISEEQVAKIEPVQVPAIEYKLPPTASDSKITTFDSSMSSKRSIAALRTLNMKPTLKMFADDIYAIGYVNLEALLRFKTSLMSRLKCMSDSIAVTIENAEVEPTATSKYRTDAINSNTLFAARVRELNDTIDSFWYRYGLITSDKRWQRYLEERKTTGVPPVRRDSILDSMLPQITNLYVNLLDCSEPLGLMMFISLVTIAMNEQFNGRFAFVRDSIDPYVLGSRFRMLQYYASIDPSDPSYSSSGGGGGGGDDDQMYISSWSSRDRNIAARNTPDPVTEQRLLSTLIPCTTSKLKRTGPGLATTNPIHLALVSRLGERWRPVLPAVKITGTTVARLTTSSGTCYDLPREERITRMTTYDETAFTDVAKGLGYVNHVLIEHPASGGGTSVFLVDGTRLSFFATPEKAKTHSSGDDRNNVRENNNEDCVFNVYRIPSFVNVIKRENVSVTPSYVRNERESSSRSLAWFGVRYRVQAAIRQEQTIILHVTIYHAPEFGSQVSEIEVDDVGNVCIRVVGDSGKRRIVVAIQQIHLDPTRDSIESAWLQFEPIAVQDDSFTFNIDSHRLSIRLFVDNAIMSTAAA